MAIDGHNSQQIIFLSSDPNSQRNNLTNSVVRGHRYVQDCIKACNAHTPSSPSQN
ncbi:unnamed protein product [Musa hybrid cultivar]